VERRLGLSFATILSEGTSSGDSLPKCWSTKRKRTCFYYYLQGFILRWRNFNEFFFPTIRLSHLLGNVIFQLILGLLLEIVHHWQRISAVYMAGVLGGSLAVTVLDPQRYSLGASAGVYGLLLAHLATIILNWDQMDCKICRVFWLLAYIGYDAGSTIYSKLFLHVDSQVNELTQGWRGKSLWVS